jgi:parallel beta-helix repeat protein
MKRTITYLFICVVVFASLSAAYPVLASTISPPSNIFDSPDTAAIGRAPIGYDTAFYGLGGFLRFTGGYFRFGITAAITNSLVAPSNGAAVSGSSVLLTASASAPLGIANVQFEVDGTDIGSAVTSPPYTTTWNSTDLPDGSHTLYAVAEDTSGNYATSSVAITNDNTPPTTSGSYSCLHSLYVSTTGNDANTGLSIAQAFATISHGASVAHAGDCVMVEPGTYQQQVTISNGGNADTSTGYVALVSQIQHAAKITPFSGEYSAVNLGSGANYVIVDGFDIQGGNGHGIDAMNTHHNKFLDNVVHDSGGSGISAAYGDYYTIEGNITHNNSSTNTFQTSGISVYQARAISDSLPGFHIIVSGNISYLNQETYSGSHTDGNGIIIDDFHNSQGGSTAGNYPYTTLVENNLVYGNGGKGIALNLSDDVTIRNNTAYFNNRDNLNTGTWRGDLNNEEGSNNTWVNNIAFADPSVNANNTAIGDESCCGYTTSGVIWKNNLTFNGTAGVASVLVNGSPSTVTAGNGNQLGVDPKFINPSLNPTSADFHLQSTSPAISAGTSTVGVPAVDLDEISRPNGAVDIGAYAFVSPTVVIVTAPAVSPKTVYGTAVNLIASFFDNEGLAGVQFEVNGANVGASGTASPYSITWNSTSVPDGTTTIAAIAHDAAGNVATSSVTVIVENTPPGISSISSGTPTPTTATITWTTNKPATSQIAYGTSSSYTTSTTLNSSLVTSHSVSISSLTPNTTYHFDVLSADIVGNLGTSADQTFLTITPPNWILPGAAVDLDFADNQYYGDVLSNLISVSRASPETCTSVEGVITYAANNAPCITDLGLAVWESRTNLFKRSQAFSVSPWFTNGPTRTDNSTSSPDGTNTAAMIAGAGAGFQNFDQTVSVTSGNSYTQSVYCKAGTAQRIALRGYVNASTQAGAIFDCSNGTFVGFTDATHPSLSISTLTNGWYRFSITTAVTNTTSTAAFNFYIVKGSAIGTTVLTTDNIYIWGAQVELGSFVGPYIPTTTAVLTRPADNISTAGALSSSLASSVGSLVATTTQSVASTTGTIMDSNGNILLGKTATDALTSNLVAGLTTSNTATWTALVKSGIAWDATGRSLVLKNGTVATDANAMTPATTFHLGSISGSSAFFDGNIQRIAVFNSKLSNSTLGSFTQ